MSQTQPNILEDYGIISMKVNLLNEELSKMNKQKAQEVTELAQISIDKDRLLEEEKKAREACGQEQAKLKKVKDSIEVVTLEKSNLLAEVRTLKDEKEELLKEKEHLLNSILALKKSKEELEQSNAKERESIEQERALIEKRKATLIQVIQNV